QRSFSFGTTRSTYYCSSCSAASPLKKGEKNSIWSWPIYKIQLPVTCGDQVGTLKRDRLRCIVVGKQWFTPSEFERFAGKTRSRNWKMSIRCQDTPLGKLIEVYGRRCLVCFSVHGKKAHHVSLNVSQPGSHLLRPPGTCGKSIRTETNWMTPVEFLKVASCPTDASWKKEIQCEGGPLSVLIEANILRIHSLLCNCLLCKPDGTDLNDDECCVCRREDEDDLVVCDHCPRSFHQKCHLPHVEDPSSIFLWTESRHPFFSWHPQLNDYSSVIKTPMWLGHIADQLQNQLYWTVGEFVNDVQLIFSNCALYNRVKTL
uniref:SP110 nuclear body protein n=1 Tax=Cyclopterus lumpus TaxID=8103 RepID=A0A8C3G124_CYCLU